MKIQYRGGRFTGIGGREYKDHEADGNLELTVKIKKGIGLYYSGRVFRRKMCGFALDVELQNPGQLKLLGVTALVETHNDGYNSGERRTVNGYTVDLPITSAKTEVEISAERFFNSEKCVRVLVWVTYEVAPGKEKELAAAAYCYINQIL